MTKSAQRLSFRRFLLLKSGSHQMKGYFGIDAFMFREWIEGKWADGMNWANYGTYWVVDHIVPLRMFNLAKEEDLKLVWNYRNAMPLLAEDNHKKEGNVYLSYVILKQIKGNDIIYNELYDRIKHEVDQMDKYVETYCKPFSFKS